MGVAATELRGRSSLKFLQLLSVLIVCWCPPTIVGQLMVTSLPDALFQVNGGVHNVVEGTVIQLYCEADFAAATFSWTKDGSPVVINVPHLRERTSSEGNTATSVLTIDGFYFSDDGAYECTAMDGDNAASGDTTTLTAISASATGALSITRAPNDVEAVFEMSIGETIFLDNRTGVVIGQNTNNGSMSTYLLVCEIGISSSDPTIVWIRNGVAILGDSNHKVTTMVSMPGVTVTSNLEIISFALSDVGEYQCIATDDDSDEEIIMSKPYRLDTDIILEGVNTVILERVSPEVIFLRPPEKLVIEVEATGRYSFVRWQKNVAPLTLTEANSSNHLEILVLDPTTAADLALYEVSLRASPTSQRNIPPDLDFIVTSPVDANTTANNGSAVTVLEGGSVILSCTSFGAPVPTITWEFNNQPVQITPTISVTQSVAMLVRSNPNDPNSALVADVVTGSNTSSIEIVNASYPEDEGVYTCIGSNDNLMLNTSTDTIRLQVIVFPVVEVTALDSRTRVSLGGSTTLFCNVTRTNPVISTFVWRNEGTGTILGETSNTLDVSLSAEEDFATYSCTATNNAGATGSDSVNITQGFPPMVTTFPLPLPIVLGADVVLVCIITGVDPPDSITWTFNGMVVDTGNENFTLTVSTVADYDVYTCNASNEFGSDSDTIEVTQAVAPVLAPQSMDIVVEVLTQLILIANISDFNLAIDGVAWMRDGSVIQSGNGFTLTNNSLDAPPAMVTLTLDVMTPNQDSGIYTVNVSNPAGSDTSTFNVSVTAPSNISFPEENTDVTVLEDRDDIVLNCTASGLPAPTIEWYRGTRQLTGAEDRMAITPGTTSVDASGLYIIDSTLTISPSDRDDSDTYSCVATNTVLGTTRTDSVDFNVTVNFFVTIYEDPVDVSVLAPDAAMLTCQADGEPLPDIVWVKMSTDGGMTTEFNESTGNIIINETVNGLNKTSVLIIQPTSALDTADYRCRVQNEVGSVMSGTARVTVYVAPNISSPENGTIFLVNISDDTTITCTASAVPPPDIEFFYNGTVLTRTGDEMGIGDEIPMRVQVGAISNPPERINNGNYEVSRNLTLFNARDEPLTGFECRAVNNITELDLMPNDTVAFEFLVQVPATITTPPRNITVVSPNNATLTCTADGVPAPDIVWLREYQGMPMPVPLMVQENDTNVTVIEIIQQQIPMGRTTTSTISFFFTQPPFAADYTCRASNLLGTVEEIATLTIHVVPVILEPQENTIITVDQSTSAMFDCSAAGIPPPTIFWVRVYDNGTTEELTMERDERVMLLDSDMDSEYDLENRGVVTQVNRTLNLTNTRDSDSGTYRCVASNEAGNDTQDFELVVQVPPMVLVSPMDTTVIEGEDAIFTCRVTGRPRPSIVWFYLESLSAMPLMTMPPPLNETDGNYSVDREGFGDRELESNLTVIRTLPSDTGFYVCFAENAVDGGIAMENGSLSVEVPPMIQTVYPELGQTSYTVNETEMVTFQCSATGIPDPAITWFRNGVELSGPRVSFREPSSMNFIRDSDGETVRLVTRTLQLNNTEDADSGTYTCNATNSAGDDGEPFELIVQIAPSVTELLPLEQTVTSPTAATFTCSATGRPMPSISWYRVELSDSRTLLPDDQSVEVGSGEREITSTLTVGSTFAADAADYVCVASNIVDDDEMIASLTVYVIPNIIFAAPEGGVYVVNETFPVTFLCNATGIPTPEIQWMRGLMPLDPANDNSSLAQRIQLSSPDVDEPERSVGSVTRTLTISDTMEGDAGNYSCVATNDATMGRDEDNFRLFVQVRPEISPVNEITEITGEEFGMVTLSFVITRAIPSVAVEDIQWLYSPDFSETPFDSVENITNLTRRIDQSNYTFSPDLLSLTIRNIAQARSEGEPTDRGRYFLVATNPAGSGFSYIDLLVAGPPVISTPPMDQFVINNGSSAVFNCSALAIPPHDVYWSFTNASGVTSPVISTLDSMNTTEYQINTVNGTVYFGTLTVVDVRYEDRGVYTCNATNEIGSDLASATLTVHVSPVIVRVSDATDVIIDNSTYLFCLATGFPIPTISWLKDNGSINLYSDVSLNMRIDIFEFDARNESDVSSGFMGSGSLPEFLSTTTLSASEIMDLGELGVVSFLRFYDVVREDTAMYSCVAVNELEQTTRLRNESSSVQLTVLEPPDPPVNVEIMSRGARWVYLRWNITFDGNRPVNRTRISIYSTEMMPDERPVSSGDTMYNVTDLLPFTNYSFGVVACNVIGCGLQSNLSQVVMTREDTSTEPRDFMVEDASETTITVSWRTPAMPNGVISQYRLTAIGTKSYDTTFTETKNFMVNGDTTMTELSGLTPGTTYDITIYAVNGAGTGEIATTSTTTLNAAPVTPGPGEEPSVGAAQADNVRTVFVTFVEFDSTNGPISHYQVGVVLLPEGASVQNLQHPDVLFPNLNGTAYDPSTCDRASPSAATAYVTAEFASSLFPSDNVFVVGLASSPNDRTSVYTNGELCYSKRYAFFLRAYPVANPANQRRSVRQTDTTPPRQYTTFSSTVYTAASSIPDAPAGPGGIIAGVVVGVLLVAAIIVVIIIIIVVVVRRHSVKVYSPQGFATDMYDFSNDGFKLTDYNQIDNGSAPHQPIPVASLADHVERNHLNENCGFSEEYKVIQERSAKHTVDACTAPDNKPRNRYANIQCYDHSRVLLTPIEGYEHDYINGNFVDGYNREKEYIATQGPLPDTVGDFWRLVWDYNIPSIVMLTNLMEKMKVKCSQYWPNTGSQQYANINVTLINTIQQADFTIRHFQIKSVSSEEVREVRQFHFTSWPDFGVPRHPTPLLYFLRRIRNSHPYSNEKPILIHCSAGVGRTGSLITIDVELQRARQKQVVDTFNYVLQMREKRNHMVQTEGQYVFLHDAILEGYTSGDTEIVVGKLAKRMTELEAVDDEGISGFRKEFERLREFKVNVREFTDANDDANKFKNRIANALPYNYNRVHLKMSPGIGGSDYINASFIDGYAHKMTYIATQGPLKNTVEDFWRLIWERESGVIVMLTQLEEKGKEQCAQYWPESKNSPEKMGSQLSVELLSEGEFEDYICRELKVTDLTSTDNKHRVVKQFHFTAWPESGAPSTGAGMIDLIDQVIRTQQHTGNKPIVVHCSAGIGRTGAFCALSTAIERVKAEGIVDVFHTVKHLRTQRPHMVQTVDQYAFCYYAIKEYLESLSNYSNFDY